MGDVLKGIQQNFGIDDTLSMAETSQKYKKRSLQVFQNIAQNISKINLKIIHCCSHIQSQLTWKC